MNFGSSIYKGNPRNSLSWGFPDAAPTPLARLEKCQNNHFLYKEFMNFGSFIYVGNPSNSSLRSSPDGAPPSQTGKLSKELLFYIKNS